MIKKNASDKYVLTAEDAELLGRFSVYAKRTLANKRAEYYRKLKPILDHEHLYEDLSAADKKRCQGSPFTVEEIPRRKMVAGKAPQESLRSVGAGARGHQAAL